MTVRAGEVYRHYKGRLYMVLAVADYTGKWDQRIDGDPLAGFAEGVQLVVYVALYDNPHGNRPCVRPLSEWNDRVGTMNDETGLARDVLRYELVP